MANKLVYRRSILDKSINISNFETDGIVLEKISYDHADFALGTSGLNWEAFTEIATDIDPDVPLEKTFNYATKHWVDKKLYDRVFEILSEFGLSEHTSTLCYILLAHKLFDKILHEPLPKYEPHELLTIKSFIEMMFQNSDASLNLLNSNRSILAKLNSSQLLLLAKIVKEAYFNTAEGVKVLDVAEKIDAEKIEFYKKVEGLPIKNRANTAELMRTRLIQRLFLLLSNRIPEPTSRTLVIARLLLTIRLVSQYDNALHSGYANERNYYYEVLKYATLQL